MGVWIYKFNHFALIILLLLVTQLIACGDDVKKSTRNLETGVVRIEIEGRRFNVPLRYMYTDAVEKHGSWPTPKRERTEVGALGFSVLLPDLRPYYPEGEARWKVRGHGDRLNGSIMKPVGGGEWYEWVVERKLEDVTKGRAQKGEDIHGLRHFVTKIDDSYLSKDNSEIMIRCTKPVSSEDDHSRSCKVRSSYMEGIVFEYYYGLPHLSRWREIDDGIKAMFDKFGKAAKAETLN